MKIIIAPDSFKGTIPAARAAEIIAEPFRGAFPNGSVIQLPLADGGEGTLEAVASALDLEMVEVEAEGPDGNPVKARYGLDPINRKAVIESAQACGMGLIPVEKLNPLKLSSAGVGDMIRNALDREVRDIVVTLGGSATVDGGLGMARALGYRLLDSQDREIPAGGGGLFYLQRIDSSQADPRLSGCRFLVAADVDNPLSGPNGAAPVFGPQKGADPAMVPLLDRGLNNLLHLLIRQGMLRAEAPGDGAAGGLGAALRAFCRAEIRSGAEWVCDAVGLDSFLSGADLLITGEGRVDRQTLQGKLCRIVSRHARKQKVPVLLLCGVLELDEGIEEMADFVFSCSCGLPRSALSPEKAEADLARCARSCAKLIECFRST